MGARQSAYPAGDPLRGALTAQAAIEIAIFDLDDTLYDCYGQRVVAAHRHASQAMAEAGVPGSVEEILRARLEAFRTNPHLEHIDAEVCRRFHVSDPEQATRRAREAYFSCPVGALRLFRGTRRTLRTLHQRGVRNFVVSFGHPHTQRAKVSALGLDREPALEHVLYADTGMAVTKEAAFSSILQLTEAEPARVLVVGDRPNGEIRAGKKLGMHTVRIRHGEFAALEPQGREEEPDFEIAKIEAVLKLPYQFGSVLCGNAKGASRRTADDA